MAKNFKVSAVFDAIDKLSAPMRKMSREMNAFTASTAKATSALHSVGPAVSRLSSTSNHIRSLGSHFSDLSSRVSHVGSEISSLTTKLVVFGGIGVAGFYKTMVQPAADAETQLLSFEAVLKDTTLAKQKFNDIKLLAEKTPYEFADMKKMWAFTEQAGFDSSNESLLGLVDITSKAGLTGDRATESIRQLMQAFSKGKLLGSESRILQENFIDIQGAIMSITGKTKKEVLDMQEDGEIGLDLLMKAVQFLKDDAKGAGEKFGKSWTGITSTMKDRWLTAVTGIMDAGPFQFLKDKVNEVSGHINALFSTTKGKAQLKVWGENITNAFKSIESGINTVFNAVNDFNNWIGESKGTDMHGNKLKGWANTFKLVGGIVAAVLLGPLIRSIVLTSLSLAKLGVFLIATTVKLGVMATSAVSAAIANGTVATSFKKVAMGALFAGRAMLGFTAALLVNPIFLAVTALAALAGAFIYTDEIRAWLGTMPNTFKDKWNSVIDFLNTNPFEPVINRADMGPMSQGIREDWDKLSAWFGSLNLMEQGAKIITSLWDGMKSKWNELTSWARGGWDSLKQMFTGQTGSGSGTVEKPSSSVGAAIKGATTPTDNVIGQGRFTKSPIQSNIDKASLPKADVLPFPNRQGASSQVAAALPPNRQGGGNILSTPPVKVDSKTKIDVEINDNRAPFVKSKTTDSSGSKTQVNNGQSRRASMGGPAG